MRKSRMAAVVLALVLASIAFAAPAQATFHGRNGQIVFVKGSDIWGVQPNGKGLHRVTRFRGQESQPSLSPTGRTLAFQFDSPGETAEIFTSDLHSHHPRWITK